MSHNYLYTYCFHYSFRRAVPGVPEGQVWARELVPQRSGGARRDDGGTGELPARADSLEGEGSGSKGGPGRHS